LENVTLNYGLKSIGNYAFFQCDSLKSIEIPGSVTNIGEYAFYGCINLETVTLNYGLKSISGYAFYRCTSLKSIEIPGSVTKIGVEAFRYCTGLQVLFVPDVSSVGNDAFDGCTGLVNVTIERSDLSPFKLTGLGKLKYVSLRGGGELPAGFLSNCPNLVSVDLVKFSVIGENAFQSCSSLENISLSYETLHEFNSSALTGATELKMIEFTFLYPGNYSGNGVSKVVALLCPVIISVPHELQIRGWQNEIWNGYCLPTKSFSKSTVFRETRKCSQTAVMSETKFFDGGGYVMVTSYFSGSAVGTESNIFKRSFTLSESESFSVSWDVVRSNVITESKTLSDSRNPISKSNNFEGSFSFSESSKFVESSLFSKSEPLSPSQNLFSESGKLVTSLSFSESSRVVKPSLFSKSEPLSPSQNLFNESDKLEISSYFSMSDVILQSNGISESEILLQSQDILSESVAQWESQGLFDGTVMFSNSAALPHQKGKPPWVIASVVIAVAGVMVIAIMSFTWLFDTRRRHSEPLYSIEATPGMFGF
jgi:hypothetical protein